MKLLTILYRNSGHQIKVPLPSDIATQLYNDIYTARIEGKTTLRINASNMSRFIDPSEIIDCMIIDNDGN